MTHQVSWWVVFRNRKPVASFVTKGIAEDWKNECPHRSKDVIAKRILTFKGIHGYSP